MAISSLQTATANLTDSIVRSAEQSPEVATKLLKKALDSDKNLVNTLLPSGGQGSNRVNIGA